MEVKYVMLSVSRLETTEERMKRENREVALRCIAGAVVALCVGSVALGWYAIEANREIIRETETLKNTEIQRIITDYSDDILKTAPDLRMSEYFVADIYDGCKETMETSTDLYVVESTGRENPSPLTGSEWVALVKSCTENGIPVEVGFGLIWVESRFDRNAVSKAGCYGLAQLNPRYFPTGLSSEDNIRYGMNYLGSCLSRYGTMEAALTAYHDGHDTGQRGYANEVLAVAEKWRMD